MRWKNILGLLQITTDSFQKYSFLQNLQAACFFSLWRVNAQGMVWVEFVWVFQCVLLWYNVFVMIVLILFSLLSSLPFCSFMSVTPRMQQKICVYRRNLCISSSVLYPVSLVFESCILTCVHRSVLSSEGTLQRFLNKESLKILDLINNSKAVICVYLFLIILCLKSQPHLIK